MRSRTSSDGPRTFERVLTITALIVAGEAIFGLPFHVARFFRPTVLAVFDFTNTELGKIQSVYGVAAMISYFAGGPLADYFSARRLLAASLAATSVGGLYFASFPGYGGMCVLYGFFGVTTILLFWAALIRATREWGSTETQGWAYGVLDGGRGLVAALLASGIVVLFAAWFPEDASAVTPAQRAAALRKAILVYAAATFLTAVFVWFAVPERDPRGATRGRRFRLAAHLGGVLRLPIVWLQSAVVICAYVGFKGSDNYSLYAVQAYGMDEVAGARVSTIGAWLRPPAAVAAGLLGDRLRASRAALLCFCAVCASYLLLVLLRPDPAAPWVLYLNVVVGCAGLFGLRALYFAMLEEGGIGNEVTGAAVGVISVLGYTPDVFVSPVGGWLLDRSPGVAGHQHFLLFLLAFAGLGIVASLAFARVAPRARCAS